MLDLNLRKKKASIIKHILFPIYFGCRSIVYNIYLCCVVAKRRKRKYMISLNVYAAVKRMGEV